MEISEHGVKGVICLKTNERKISGSGRAFYTRELIIVDDDGGEQQITLFSDHKIPVVCCNQMERMTSRERRDLLDNAIEEPK